MRLTRRTRLLGAVASIGIIAATVMAGGGAAATADTDQGPMAIGYTPVTLRVSTSPAVPAQITIDDHIADTWGLQWVKLSPIYHKLCFGDVPGYTTPSPKCRTVVFPDGTATVVGTYTPRGYLHVTTSPPVASQISVDGIPRNDWGMWTDLDTGSHEVCFGAVTGYTAPGCQTVAVTAGATTDVTGSFTLSDATGLADVGLLRVTTSPALPSQVLVDGTLRDTWGLNWLEIPAGSHSVCFTRVEGWTEPACKTVTVTSGATTTVVGTFEQRGYLQVTTAPAVPGTVFLDGYPADDWGIFTDVPIGTHQVCFQDAPGYDTPGCKSVVVLPGQTASVVGTYR